MLDLDLGFYNYIARRLSERDVSSLSTKDREIEVLLVLNNMQRTMYSLDFRLKFDGSLCTILIQDFSRVFTINIDLDAMTPDFYNVMVVHEI